MREIIKTINGKQLGTIEEDSKGNKIARDFYGKILGKYDKQENVTKDFYGRKLSRGDITMGLVWQSFK